MIIERFAIFTYQIVVGLQAIKIFYKRGVMLIGLELMLVGLEPMVNFDVEFMLNIICLNAKYFF